MTTLCCKVLWWRDAYFRLELHRIHNFISIQDTISFYLSLLLLRDSTRNLRSCTICLEGRKFHRYIKFLSKWLIHFTTHLSCLVQTVISCPSDIVDFSAQDNFAFCFPLVIQTAGNFFHLCCHFEKWEFLLSSFLQTNLSLTHDYTLPKKCYID